MEAKFYLRSFTSKKPQKIRIVFNYLSTRFQIDSGQKIKPSDWSKNRQKALTSYENHEKLNDLLEEQGKFVKKYFKETSLSQKRPYVEELQKEVNYHHLCMMPEVFFYMVHLLFIKYWVINRDIFISQHMY